LEDFEEEG
jgi:hypothetical protein